MSKRRVFKPESDNQKDLIRSMVVYDIVFCVGPAGSGKTAFSVGLAIEHLLARKAKFGVRSKDVSAETCLV